MAETIILTTNWGYNYWELKKPAKFPSTNISERIPNWRDLKEKCPLPAIGLYTDQFTDKRFDYILIKGITADTDGTPYFEYDFISKGFKESCFLEAKINRRKGKFYYAVESSLLLESLASLDQRAPQIWMDLLEKKQSHFEWSALVGQYFLDLKEKSLGNEDFEDRTAALLTAIGFDVVQKGYTRQGAFPDGVASYGTDLGLVFDCKNSVSYYPSAEHNRALASYYKDEKRVYRDKEMFPCFIPKSSSANHVGDNFILPIEPWLYLLSKKLKMGSKFKLEPLKNILINKVAFTQKNIDDFWVY